MYRNVLKVHFLNAQYRLENVIKASSFNPEVHHLVPKNSNFKAQNMGTAFVATKVCNISMILVFVVNGISY